MRTTLSLDDDVVALLERVRRSKDIPLKQLVNDALREGLARLSSPVKPAPFRTQPRDLGNCYFPDIDNVQDVLDEAEGSRTGR